MKRQSSFKVFLGALICFLVGFASLPQAEACQNHRKKSRSAASVQHKKAKKLTKNSKAKKLAKHKHKKGKRIVAPARVRIIDTGKKVGPDNFPIPDMDKLHADTGNPVVEPSRKSSGSPDLTSAATDDFQDFENQ